MKRFVRQPDNFIGEPQAFWKSAAQSSLQSDTEIRYN
jgi:hypothetical protein